MEMFTYVLYQNACRLLPLITVFFDKNIFIVPLEWRSSKVLDLIYTRNNHWSHLQQSFNFPLFTMELYASETSLYPVAEPCRKSGWFCSRIIGFFSILCTSQGCNHGFKVGIQGQFNNNTLTVFSLETWNSNNLLKKLISLMDLHLRNCSYIHSIKTFWRTHCL